MDTLRKMKMEKLALKLYIFACGFGLTAYTGLLCFDIRSAIAEWLSMSAAFVILTMGAWAFRLCWIAYTFIAYCYVIRCCIILQGEGFFGKWIDVAHWVAFTVGSALCVLFVTKCFIFNNCTNEKPEINSEDASADGR